VHAEGADDQRLTIREALAAYTRDAAYASFDEQRKGVLAPGMLADLVVLTRDIVAAPPFGPRRSRRGRHHLRWQNRVPTFPMR
jgi:predicted amidohydrolase YtcJ